MTTKKIRSPLDWIVAFAVVGAIATGVYWYTKIVPVSADPHPIESPETEQLGFFRDRVNLLLTVATLFLGGGGSFIIKSKTRLQHGFALAAIVASALSMWFGAFAYATASWMLDKGFFDLQTTEVALPSNMQVWSAVAALVALIGSFFLAAHPVSET